MLLSYAHCVIYGNQDSEQLIIGSITPPHKLAYIMMHFTSSLELWAMALSDNGVTQTNTEVNKYQY